VFGPQRGERRSPPHALGRGKPRPHRSLQPSFSFDFHGRQREARGKVQNPCSLVKLTRDQDDPYHAVILSPSLSFRPRAKRRGGISLCPLRINCAKHLALDSSACWDKFADCLQNLVRVYP